jgi:hypothetical protein
MVHASSRPSLATALSLRAREDCFDGLSHGDQDDGNEVLYQGDNPSRGCPQLALWVLHLTGAAHETRSSRISGVGHLEGLGLFASSGVTGYVLFPVSWWSVKTDMREHQESSGIDREESAMENISQVQGTAWYSYQPYSWQKPFSRPEDEGSGYARTR